MTDQPAANGPNPEDSEPTPNDVELTDYLAQVADENGVVEVDPDEEEI